MTTTTKTMDDLLTSMAEALGLQPGGVKPTSKADDFAQWDSMATMNIMIMLDDEFGLSLKPGDASKIQSVPGIVSLLRTRGCLS